MSLSILLTTVPLVFVACSGRVTSLDPAKRTESLTIAETAQYCQDLKDFRAKQLADVDVKKSNCTAKARLAVLRDTSGEGDARAACRRGFEDCMQNPSSDEPFDCSTYESVFACEGLTVGDFNACFEESFANMKSKGTEDVCADASYDGDWLQKKTSKSKAGPKCQAIEMKCPRAGKRSKRRVEDDEDPTAALEIVAKMEGFTNRMCRCKDKACADRVNEDMTRWGTEMAKTADRDSKPDPELAKRSADIMTRYTECMTKVMMAGAGAN